MTEITEKLADKAQKVNDELTRAMDQKRVVSETLQEAMEYTLFSGGKRIRPVLSIMTAELLDGCTETACRVGTALELIHTYSLIHDDLPEMDDDDFRRGEPANHRVFGSGIAILAGDGLLTYAFEVLTELELAEEKKIKIIKFVSRAAGPRGMVAGQVLDLEGEDKKIDLSRLEKIHLHKTAALIQCSILAGAYCCDVNEKQLEHLESFGQKLGLLFQITDDILDITGDQETLGKSTGRDSELNKATYPALLGLKKAKERAEHLAEQANKELDIFGEQAEDLKKLVDFILTREK